MGDRLEASIILTDQKVKFSGTCRTNTAVTMDYFPPLGEGQGYTGLELLLMSLAGCSGTSVVFLLRKMGKDITGFSVNASGTRRDQHPTCFEKINLEFTVTSRDAKEADILKAIKLSEESICPVWAMLKKGVEIEVGHKLVVQ